MKCEKCDNTVEAGAKFCGKCGEAIPSATGKKSNAALILNIMSFALYAAAIIDYAGMHFDYDLTGVSWSPYAIGMVGIACSYIAKKLSNNKTQD